MAASVVYHGSISGGAVATGIGTKSGSNLIAIYDAGNQIVDVINAGG